MRKTFKTLLILLLMIFMFGCTKTEGTLTINSNKDVKLDIKIIVDRDFSESSYLNNIEKYKLRGLDITKKTDSNYITYLISKSYSKLDNISTKKDIVIDFSKYFDADFDDRFLFKKEDDFLTDKYYANFTVDNNKIEKLISNNANKMTRLDFIKIVQDVFNNSLNEHKSIKEQTTYISEKDVLSIDKNVTYAVTLNKDNKITKINVKNKDYEYINNESPKYNDITEDKIEEKINDDKTINDIKFIVNLPVAALSNNADEVKNNGKTLIWTYNKNRKNEVLFSFELENRLNYISVFGICMLIVLVFVLVIYFSLKLRDKKREKIENEPVYRSEDEKIIIANDISEIEKKSIESESNQVNSTSEVQNVVNNVNNQTITTNSIESVPIIQEVPNIVATPIAEKTGSTVETSTAEEIPTVVNIDDK